MVSSHAIHYGNERTMKELLRIHPDEHPTSIQLFGADPEVMRGAAAVAAEAGADLIDLNMGCPVKKVRKTGAGAELISDPDLAVAVAARRRRGGREAGDGQAALGPPARGPFRRRRRRAPRRARRGSSAIAFHPRSAAVQHKGTPDYALVRELTGLIDVPVIVSGGLDSAESARAGVPRVRRRRGDDRPRLVRLPVDLRGADRAADRGAGPGGDRRRSCSG